jgi:hypothetical protein
MAYLVFNVKQLLSLAETCVDIHSIECSGRLADVLSCSQKVSHPEMRLVSAAIGASLHFPSFENFGASWFLYVSTIL